MYHLFNGPSLYAFSRIFGFFTFQLSHMGLLTQKDKSIMLWNTKGKLYFESKYNHHGVFHGKTCLSSFKKNTLKVAEFPQPVPDSYFSVSNTSWG